MGFDETEEGGRPGHEYVRESVYFCNAVCCRPKRNANPTAAQGKACQDRLWRQLLILKPKAILAVGKVATKALGMRWKPESGLDVAQAVRLPKPYRLPWVRFSGYCYYHPAYFLHEGKADNLYAPGGPAERMGVFAYEFKGAVQRMHEIVSRVLETMKRQEIA